MNLLTRRVGPHVLHESRYLNGNSTKSSILLYLISHLIFIFLSLSTYNTGINFELNLARWVEPLVAGFKAGPLEENITNAMETTTEGEGRLNTPAEYSLFLALNRVFLDMSKRPMQYGPRMQYTFKKWQRT